MKKIAITSIVAILSLYTAVATCYKETSSVYNCGTVGEWGTVVSPATPCGPISGQCTADNLSNKVLTSTQTGKAAQLNNPCGCLCDFTDCDGDPASGICSTGRYWNALLSTNCP